MGARLSAVFGRVLVGLAGTGLVAALLGGGYWVLELTVYFIPCYIVIALLGAGLCFVGNARRFALAGMLVSLVAGAHMIPLHVHPAGAATATAEPNLRIILANVFEKNWSRERFPQFARETQADLVLMQEVDKDWHNRMVALADTYPEAMYTARWPGDKMDLGEYGRRKPERVVLADELGLPATVTTYRVNGRAVKIMNLHTRSPFSANRARQHYKEFERLIAWVRKATGPVIVAGDLNSTPWSPLFRKLMRETRLQQARQGYGVAGTWPSFLGPLRIPLDHVLVTPDIGVVDFRVGPPVGSDHRPVVVDLHIPREESVSTP